MTATKEPCRLPSNYCRCGGDNCAQRALCHRHMSLLDMEDGMPYADRYCREVGRESEGFIAIREAA